MPRRSGPGAPGTFHPSTPLSEEVGCTVGAEDSGSSSCTENFIKFVSSDAFLFLHVFNNDIFVCAHVNSSPLSETTQGKSTRLLPKGTLASLFWFNLSYSQICDSRANATRPTRAFSPPEHQQITAERALMGLHSPGYA